MDSPFYLALDYDGTCVLNEYPKIGRSIGAEKWLKEIVKNYSEVRLILWTCRTDEGLAQAIKWFEDRDIPLFAVNDNPNQREWSDSPKIFANLYLDDRAIGCPLTKGRFEDNYRLDWNIVGPEIIKLLKHRKLIK